ncbi:MAG: hypothetical protein ACTSW7_04915 [Candidatus Thorarchaeota archaeon]
MKKKNTLIIIVVLLMLFINVTPLSDGFASGIQTNTTFRWHVKTAPSVGFSFYMNDGGWIAENDSMMMFHVNNVGEDIEGILTIGNASITTTDTNISIDLTLGVWGFTAWLPGLFVKVGQSNIDSLNETAYAAAERVQYNYLNGSMTSRYDNITIDSITMECIIFDYEQDPTGFGEPQLTHLAYALDTGVLVEARTSYSFGEPYILELELDFTVSVDPLFIMIGLAVTIIVIIAVVIATRRR